MPALILHVVKCFSCTVIHACLMTLYNKLSGHCPITKSPGAPLNENRSPGNVFLPDHPRFKLEGLFQEYISVIRRSCAADYFRQIGGFPAIDILEDWEFSLSMKKLGKTVLLPGPVKTSARRWLIHGKWKTTWLMHKIKVLYLLGTSPADLKRLYSDSR